MPKRTLVLDLATGIPDSALHRAVTFDASAGNVTMPAGTTVYRTVAGPLITAARTLTLASASSYAPGQRIVIADSGLNLDGATGSLALTPAGADTISASLTLIISLYGGYVELVSDGVSRFDLAAASLDVFETAIGVILNQQPTLNSGATAPNQGTTWSSIGDTEVVTKGAVAATFAPSWGQKRAFIKDDFQGFGAANFMGELGWYTGYGGMSLGYGTIEANHPGVVKLYNAIIGDYCTKLDHPFVIYPSAGGFEFRYIVKLSSTANFRCAFGAMSLDISARSAAGGYFAIYYASDNAVGTAANWHAYVSNGVNATDQDLGIAATTSYATLRVRYAGGALWFSVANSSGVFSAEVSVPVTYLSGSITPAFITVNNLSATEKSIMLDYFACDAAVTR